VGQVGLVEKPIVNMRLGIRRRRTFFRVGERTVTSYNFAKSTVHLSHGSVGTGYNPNLFLSGNRIAVPKRKRAESRLAGDASSYFSFKGHKFSNLQSEFSEPEGEQTIRSLVNRECRTGKTGNRFYEM
jgi:hypothetical protein